MTVRLSFRQEANGMSIDFAVDGPSVSEAMEAFRAMAKDLRIDLESSETEAGDFRPTIETPRTTQTAVKHLVEAHDYIEHHLLGYDAVLVHEGIVHDTSWTRHRHGSIR